MSNAGTIRYREGYIVKICSSFLFRSACKFKQQYLSQSETKESTRKTDENLDVRYKEGHERKKPKRRPVER